MKQAPSGTEKKLFHITKNLVNGWIRRQRAVKYRELPLKSLRDVIASTTRMDHGRQELDVHNVGEFPRFLQVIEPTLLHQLSNYLVGDLWKKVLGFK